MSDDLEEGGLQMVFSGSIRQSFADFVAFGYMWTLLVVLAYVVALIKNFGEVKLTNVLIVLFIGWKAILLAFGLLMTIRGVHNRAF